MHDSTGRAARPAPCRDCGAPITFRETPAGRWQAIDVATGGPHAAVCRTRRPPPAPDGTCHVCGSRNTTRSPGAGPHYAGQRCRDCGAFRWLRRPVPEVSGGRGEVAESGGGAP